MVIQPIIFDCISSLKADYIEILIENGLDLDIKSMWGSTPREYANIVMGRNYQDERADIAKRIESMLSIAVQKPSAYVPKEGDINQLGKEAINAKYICYLAPNTVKKMIALGVEGKEYILKKNNGYGIMEIFPTELKGEILPPPLLSLIHPADRFRMESAIASSKSEPYSVDDALETYASYEKNRIIEFSLFLPNQSDETKNIQINFTQHGKTIDGLEIKKSNDFEWFDVVTDINTNNYVCYKITLSQNSVDITSPVVLSAVYDNSKSISYIILLKNYQHDIS